MQIYIWKNVKKLTGNWHNNGGAVIIAENIEKARELLPKNCEGQKIKPDYILPMEVTEERVFFFPNAGCC